MLIKLLFKASLPLLSVCGATAYVMYLNGHDPLAFIGAADLYKKSTAFVQDIEETVGDGISIQSSNDSLKTIYKWQDDLGQWHYSTIMSDPNAKVQKLKINPNMNVFAREPVHKSTGTSVQNDKAKTVVKGKGDTPAVGNYSPGAIKQMFEDAKNVQTLLENRQQAQLDAIRKK